MSAAIDRFLSLSVWHDTPLGRLVPLGESVKVERLGPDSTLFKQFHPADQFSLLVEGAVVHETSEDIEADAWPMGQCDWPWAALGWSGFLPPHRNGTSARTLSDVELLSWRHEDLARIFYADPLLAVSFFRLVLDSMRRQFEWLRAERLEAGAGRPALMPVVTRVGRAERHRFAPGLLTTLRRSAFFELFPDGALNELAAEARLVRHRANTEILRQGQTLTGLWVLASGNAVSCFMTERGQEERLERFRSIAGDGGIVAGVPTITGSYTAEASVLAESTCCLYEIPATAIDDLIRRDPEFGRSYMQRHIARIAHLMTAARLPRPRTDRDPEIAAVESILTQNQARVPVNSDLYKVPHLLAHRLTVGNAFACLNTVAEIGRYEERAIARSCRDLLSGWYAEQHFYRDVLEAYREVVDAPPEAEPELLRARCDERLNSAFRHLDTEIRDIGNLPEAPGNIVIINHLSCPPYYCLPNNYHFSFDTAFVSVLLSARYGQAPVRVVRQSPGAEYGHNLFYSRLGHITVPTLESGIETATPEALEELRRAASGVLFDRGRDALASGLDVLICPEGQSQKAIDSPARFFSGGFRLALEADPEPLIVPIAIAGFDRRYKDGKLVAIVDEPFRLSEALRASGGTNLRGFIDDYRERFRSTVQRAQRLSLGLPDTDPTRKKRVKAAIPTESSVPLPQ